MKDKRKPEALFSLGISLTALGVVFIAVFDSPFWLVFIGLGIMYMIIGSKKKKKVKKK